MCEKATFIVSYQDESTIKQINYLCDENGITPRFVYHGLVFFRGGRFKMFSLVDSIYTSPIVSYRQMEKIYRESIKIRLDLLSSKESLVSCIDYYVTSLIIHPISFSDFLDRAIILFGSCPKFQAWANMSLNRYIATGRKLCVQSCMPTIIKQLRGG